MKISTKTLRRLKACEYQVSLFESIFGDAEIEITEALCLEHFDKFDWSWAASSLLTASALAEYERATASALAEYERATASASAEYARATASALAKYERVTASAFGRLAEKE